jgi:hypothetical protein
MKREMGQEGREGMEEWKDGRLLSEGWKARLYHVGLMSKRSARERQETEFLGETRFLCTFR